MIHVPATKTYVHVHMNVRRGEGVAKISRDNVIYIGNNVIATASLSLT